MKNDCFDELISSLGMAEKRISDFEDISVETHMTKKQREQSLEKKKTEQNRILQDCGTVITYLLGLPKGKENIETLVAETFPKINVRHQTRDPRDLDSTKQNKCHTQKHHSTPMHVIFKLQKNKDKEKVLKEVRKGGRNLTYRGARIRITFSPQKSCQQKKEIFKVLKEIKTPA